MTKFTRLPNGCCGSPGSSDPRALLDEWQMGGQVFLDRTAICVEAVDEPWNIFAPSPLVRLLHVWN